MSQANGRNLPPGWIKLGGYNTALQADFDAAILGNEGIATQVLGANINMAEWYWQGFNPVDLFIPAAEQERAQAILARRSEDELEPAEGYDALRPPRDSRGQALVAVGAYETIAAMRDGQTILASAKIASTPPPLAPRGNRPPGEGKRFVLYVAERDAGRARQILAEGAAEDADALRCPRCGSWRVDEVVGLVQGLADLAGIKVGREMAQCHACEYRDELAKFRIY